MSALAAELTVDPSASLLTPHPLAAAREAGGAVGAIRAARRVLTAWLQRCLRQGAYRQQAQAVAALPLAAIERQLHVALAEAGDGGIEPTHAELIAELQGIQRLVARLAGTQKSQPDALRAYDALVDSSLSALHHLSELEVELTAQQAWLDPLTGLPGRRALQQRLLAEHSRVRRHGGSCALALVDLDRFKPINDRYGHLAGDSFLVAFAAALRRLLRPYDSAFRYGGDEFVLVLPQSGQGEAEAAIARIQQDLGEQPLLQLRGQPVHAAFSAGIALLEPARSVVQSVADADARLYAAKAGAVRADR
jgi:diguanylate cyclase (GGDEF)-like protein